MAPRRAVSTALVWFRRDLRLADNPALVAACDTHASILPVYIHDPGGNESWPLGAASRWWLHHSLASLHGELLGRQGSLHLREGDTLQILQDLVHRSGARAVYWNRLYEPQTLASDSRLEAALRDQGIEVNTYNASLWSEPSRITNRQGEPYRVFTPYWRTLRAQLDPAPSPAEPRAPRWDRASRQPAVGHAGSSAADPLGWRSCRVLAAGRERCQQSAARVLRWRLQ